MLAQVASSRTTTYMYAGVETKTSTVTLLYDHCQTQQLCSLGKLSQGLFLVGLLGLRSFRPEFQSLVSHVGAMKAQRSTMVSQVPLALAGNIGSNPEHHENFAIFALKRHCLRFVDCAILWLEGSGDAVVSFR